MVSYLSLIKDALPDVAMAALAVSREAISGSGSADAVKLAKVRCWDHLKSLGLEYDFEGREACAVRAVLCTLVSDPSESDLGELTDWFLKFANTVEDHSSEIDTVLTRHLAK